MTAKDLRPKNKYKITYYLDGKFENRIVYADSFYQVDNNSHFVSEGDGYKTTATFKDLKKVEKIDS